MRKFILIVISVCVFINPTGASASKIKKAYQALGVYDYFKAKKLFYSSLKNNTSAATYGLATIFYRHDNPFHNYDSAYKYVDLCYENYTSLKPEEKKEVKNQFGLNDSVISQFKDSVCYLSYEFLLKRSKGNNIEMIEQFISYNRHSPLLNTVIELRDSLIFASVCLTNTSVAYHEFILGYPESKHVDVAENLLEKALFEENTVSKQASAYEAFMKNFPKSPFITEAQNGVYTYFMQKKNIPGLYDFIKKYPHNSNVSSAWKQIYSLSVPDYKPEALSAFLEKYPEFPYKENIQQEINLLNLELFPVKENNKFGFIDSAGTAYVSCSFDGVEDFSEGLSAAELNGKFGFIGKTGVTSIPFQFDDAESFKNGIAIVQYNGKACIIDRTGNFIASGYDDISDFSEGYAVVVKGTMQGVINKTGHIIIPIEYEKIGDFSEQIAYVVKNGKYGYIDTQGDLVIVNMFDWAETFKNGMARVKFNNKYGVIDTKGNFLLKPEYDHIDEPMNDIFVVIKNNFYGFVDRSGCLITDIIYNYSSKLKPSDITDGKYFRLIGDDYQNIAELNGKRLAGAEDYEEMYLPKNGLIRIFNEDKYGYVDEKNKQIIKTMYDDAYDFNNNIAIVRKKENWMLIDKNNKPIYSDKVTELEDLENKHYVFTLNNLKGLLDANGKTMLNAEYSEIEKLNSFLIKIDKQGKAAYYSIIKQIFIWKEPGF